MNHKTLKYPKHNLNKIIKESIEDILNEDYEIDPAEIETSIEFIFELLERIRKKTDLYEEKQISLLEYKDYVDGILYEISEYLKDIKNEITGNY